MSRFSIPRRRPSAAMIVACCALFVALGGTSYALAVGSIGSREIRDDSIQTIDVRNRSLKGNDLAPDSVGGGAIKEETLDAGKLDVSRLPAVPLARAIVGSTAGGEMPHVLVTAQGRWSNARGVSRVEHLHEGMYNVVLDRDVSSCVAVASIHSELPIGLPNAGTGEIAVRPTAGDAGAVSVFTANSSGALADQDFALLVSC